MSKLASITSLVAATAVSQAFGRFTYSVLYIEIRDDFDLSNTLAGSIGSLNLVGYLLGSLLVAYTIGNLGLVRTARHGLLGVIIGLLLLTWAPNMAVVTFALFLTGLAAAGVWVTAPALATKILGVEKQGLAVGWVTAGVGLGFVEPRSAGDVQMRPRGALDELLPKLRGRDGAGFAVRTGIAQVAHVTAHGLKVSARRGGVNPQSAGRRNLQSADDGAILERERC